MSGQFSEKMLFTAAVSRDISRPSSSALNYDWWDTYCDAARIITTNWREANLDRRAVATGSLLQLHYWDLTSSQVPGFQDFVFLHAGFYAQMFADIKPPQKALVFSPGRQFDLVAHLASIGAELTFLNSDLLKEFEDGVLSNPDFPFSAEYQVLDLQEIDTVTDLQFDMVVYDQAELLMNKDLFSWTLDRLSIGGVAHFASCNEMTRLYDDNYHLLPTFDFFEMLDARDDVSYYHLPWGAGVTVITKR